MQSQAHGWSLHRAAGEVRTQKLNIVAQGRCEQVGTSRWEPAGGTLRRDLFWSALSGSQGWLHPGQSSV